MSYYLRAFCTVPAVPLLSAVLAWTDAHGAALTLAPDWADLDLDRTDWEQVELSYAPERAPLELTVDRDDGPDSLARAEAGEFLAEVAAQPESDARLLVTGHLRQTRFIVACRLPGDSDEAGQRAAHALLDYFAEHAGGLIQADGEGFYVGDELILTLNWEE